MSTNIMKIGDVEIGKVKDKATFCMKKCFCFRILTKPFTAWLHLLVLNMENFWFTQNLLIFLPEIPSGAGSFLGLSSNSNIQS